MSSKWKSLFCFLSSFPFIFCSLIRIEPNLDETINCAYRLNNPFYECSLELLNPSGRDDFEFISGNHIGPLTNDDVIVLSSLDQTSPNVPQIICQQFQNLEQFWIERTQIEFLSETSFKYCKNLGILSLNQNKIVKVPGFVFQNSPNLIWLQMKENQIELMDENVFYGTTIEFLELDSNNINYLPTKIFYPLGPYLSFLYLKSNSIVELPRGIFESLSNLIWLDLGLNHLEIIDSKSFGNSLQTIFIVLADENKISAIDPEYFDNSMSLLNLNLEENVCVDEAFVNIPANREEVRKKLGECFDNFKELPTDPPVDEEVFIKCNYLALTPYECVLEISNKIAYEFKSIDGYHLNGFTDDHIEAVRAFTQISHNIPQIICQQFKNLRVLNFIFSQVYVLDEKSFEYCENLEAIFIAGNYLKEIPDGIFYNNQKLYSVSLIQNSIYGIYPKAFDGAAIKELELNFNYIKNFEFLNAISETLEVLNLSNNEIEKIPPATFDNFAKISILNLSSNKLLVIDSQSFNGLSAIKYFIASNNQIDAIDTRFFDSTPNLSNLDLRQNKCVDKKFENVAETLDDVMEVLEICFEGFEKERTLNCVFMSGVCYLQINNPDGLDDFTSVTGQHEGDKTDDDISIVTIYLQNTKNIPQIICQQFKNIHEFYVRQSEMSELTENSFKNCQNMKLLTIVENPLEYIPEKVIAENQYLETLILSQNQIKEIYDLAFYGSSITTLDLSSNYLQEFKNEPFGGLEHLKIFDFSKNQLNYLKAEWFGNSLENLEKFSANSNQIKIIDEEFFDGAENLLTLNLLDNICIDASFTDVMENRDEIRTKLSTCFDQEPSDENITCSYSSTPGFYNCLLTIYNPDGNEFEGIGGEHLEGYDDSNVYELQAWSQWTTNIPSIICGQFENLNNLMIIASSVEILSEKSFEYCGNLEQINLAINSLVEFPGNLFKNSPKIRFISLETNSLNKIDAAAFAGLSESLEQVAFANNFITEIPVGIFDGLKKIDRIFFGNNRIKILDSRSFGSSLPIISHLTLASNDIDAIDEIIIDETEILQTLMLSSNLCINLNFGNVAQNRDFVRAQLANCFENFRQLPSGLIKCLYFNQPAVGSYSCIMEIYNPNGSEFSSIEGDHVDDLDDADVTDVIISNQITQNVPTIICEKFTSLKVFSAVSSQIQILNEKSFESCENLEVLSLTSNLITELPENSFVNLVKLFDINISSNQLTRISQTAFGDSVLANLLNVYLQNNQINAIDTNFFDEAQNLRILFLSGNLCAPFNFNDVSLFRDAVRQLLMECFNNYQSGKINE